jgi:hypothetical protein
MRAALGQVEAVVVEPNHASLSACDLELGSRAEAKGGGAPAGMSATAAVASRPKYTAQAY